MSIAYSARHGESRLVQCPVLSGLLNAIQVITINPIYQQDLQQFLWYIRPAIPDIRLAAELLAPRKLSDQLTFGVARAGLFAIIQPAISHRGSRGSETEPKS